MRSRQGKQEAVIKTASVRVIQLIYESDPAERVLFRSAEPITRNVCFS